MAPLTPCPLAPHLPLAAAIARAPVDGWLGVWFRWPRSLRLVVRRGHHCHPLLLDGDLGWLLRHCAAIAVQLGAEVAVMRPEELSRVRALRIDVSLRHRSAEEVLAACAAARVRVLRSGIVYGRIPG